MAARRGSIIPLIIAGLLGLVLVLVVRQWVGGGGGDSEAGGEPTELRDAGCRGSRRVHDGVDRGLQREGGPAGHARRAVQRVEPEGRRDVHVDDGVHQGQRRCGDGAGPRLGREGRRAPARRLEPRVQLVGGAGRPGVHRPRPPQPDAQGAPVPGADPARDRHAAAHGPGPGLAGRADRLEGPGRDREVAEGVGQQGPPGVGPLQARQDQPVLLDLRAERDDRVLLRGDRRVQRPHVRAGRRPRDPGVRQAAGVLRRPLRRHDPDLPGEHEPGGRRRAGPDLRLGGHRRGEVRAGLQPGQPDRGPRDPGPAATAHRPPGCRVPLRWNPSLGQPLDRPGRRVGR